jgi:hypothetical protein
MYVGLFVTASTVLSVIFDHFGWLGLSQRFSRRRPGPRLCIDGNRYQAGLPVLTEAQSAERGVLHFCFKIGRNQNREVAWRRNTSRDRLSRNPVFTR